MKEEDKQFLKDNYLKMLDREMAEVIGCSRGTVSTWCRKLGLVRPKEIASARKSHAFTPERREYYRQLAQTNENMIKNRFQIGHSRSHRSEVGTKIKEKRDGYWRIKVSDVPNLGIDNWKYLHRMVWEEHYGPIPPKQHIIFLDGNKDNLSIDNLAMIDNKTFAIMNRYYAFTDNAETTKTYIELAKLKLAISDTKRRKNGNQSLQNNKKKNQ